MEQTRSAIPKVVGILMIVFASLGLLQTVVSMLQAQLIHEAVGAMTFTRVLLIVGVLDLGIGVLHLMAGLRALAYKDNAPRLAILYGILKIVTTLGMFVLAYAFMRSSLGGIGGEESAMIGFTFLVSSIFYLAWPIVVLALMTRPSAKAACANF